MVKCFEDCDCQCGKIDKKFDRIATKELAVPITLNQLSRSNIGWFSDRSICEHNIEDWGLDRKEGMYILWHKSDYCTKHEHFHMTALYVGKGFIGKRLRDHWKHKDFSEELLIYFAYVELPNRLAKYIEQLLLDLYDLPYNKAENSGTMLLCAHFTQSDVD